MNRFFSGALRPRRSAVLFGSLLLFAVGCEHLARKGLSPEFYSGPVGRLATNRFMTPTGQLLTPAGKQIELPGMRPQVLALSPDGRLLVTAGKGNALALLDAATGELLQKPTLKTNPPPSSTSTNSTATNSSSRATAASGTNTASNASTNRSGGGFRGRRGSSSGSSTNKAEGDVEMSFNGLIFSPDGKRIFASTIGGSVRVFSFDSTGKVTYPKLFPLPKTGTKKDKSEIPSGLAISRDGKRLYVAGNLSNQLLELDAANGKVLRTWKTGVAPFEVILAGEKIYVSNWGGRAPEKDELVEPSGSQSSVLVDPIRFLPTQGSVTVIDLKAGIVHGEITTGLHSSAMALSPNGKYLVVANSSSDTLSVIDTSTDRIIEKIWTRQTPADLFGAQPNALAFDQSGERLYVCNGTQNAVAVVEFEPKRNASGVVGLIPTGWFPGAVLNDPARRRICVANIKGLGALKNFKPDDKIKLTTKDWYGAISLIPWPSKTDLGGMTKLALANMRYPKLAEAFLPPRAGQPARPVPERAGEPSVFKHVIYVIKENRTYDQVLGDMREGNGDTNLCTFGEKFTPNQHKIAREFVLLDNTYCSGVQSADGHQWTDSGIATEYAERQLTAGWPRSYPGGKAEDGSDAIAWAPTGFIWDNALANGKHFRNYGEWMITEAGWRDKSKHKTNANWKAYYDDYTKKTRETVLKSHAALAGLRTVSKTDTVGWDLNVPDQMRAAAFIKELHQFETNGGFPELLLLFLPNDHTGGTGSAYPKPAAQIADNDLAFGKVVEAVSHSKFWKDTCIIAIEDDPQAGWDHVSGYRTTCYVASAYTKRRTTVSTQYNQLSILRTIELILGLPPMNQMDATATPMGDCFSMTSDLTPFQSVPNKQPLDEMNARSRTVTDARLRRDAEISASLPLDEPDKCPEDLLNRILWRAMKGPNVPYPEWAVKLVVDND